MKSLCLMIIITLLISLSTWIYADKNSSEKIGNIQNQTTSKNLNRREIINDFYKFREWLIDTIFPEKNIRILRKKVESYDIKSVEQLVLNLTNLATVELKSGDTIHKDCNVFLISVKVDGIMHTIRELRNCDVCSEKNLKSTVNLLKIEIESEETLLDKCHGLGILNP